MPNLSLIKNFFSKNVVFLFIISIQIISIKSGQDKCYSILNCEKCPELDFCEKCSEGFVLRNQNTKCINKFPQNTNNNQINNNINQKKSSSSSSQNQPKKSPINQFKNIPFKSIQQAKENDLNRTRINRLLIIIIILLAISIIISAAYDFIKKLMRNNNEEYDIQEEGSKVIIR